MEFDALLNIIVLWIILVEIEKRLNKESITGGFDKAIPGFFDNMRMKMTF